jgi:hypothetical protein
MDQTTLLSAPLDEVHAYLVRTLGTRSFSTTGDEIDLMLPARGPANGPRMHRFRTFRRSQVVDIASDTHVLPDGWAKTLCEMDAGSAAPAAPHIDSVSCAECRVKALAAEIATPQGVEGAVARRVEVARPARAATGRSKTDLYLDCVEQAVANPGQWVRVRSFSSKANADVTGRCLEGGFLRVLPRDGEPSINVNGKTWLRTAAPIRFRVGEASEGWPLDIIYHGRG